MAPEDAVDHGFRNRDAVIALEIPHDADRAEVIRAAEMEDLLDEALLHESSLARTMPQDAAHYLPDEVPEARQKQPESGPTQLRKRPINAQ